MEMDITLLESIKLTDDSYITLKEYDMETHLVYEVASISFKRNIYCNLFFDTYEEAYASIESYRELASYKRSE